MTEAREGERKEHLEVALDMVYWSLVDSKKEQVSGSGSMSSGNTRPAKDGPSYDLKDDSQIAPEPPLLHVKWNNQREWG